jgi:UDP-glucose 4-epimerase
MTDPAHTAARDTGRRSVVTGGAGFIGTHLVERLLAAGESVAVVDDLSTGSEDQVPPAAELIKGDLLEVDLLQLFRRWRPSRVFHLAAQASVARSLQDPARDLAVNVAATHRLGAAVRDAGVGRLVFVSSGGAVYGDTNRAATERSLPAPTSVYGVHKLAAEGHVRIAGVRYAIARPANVYGPRQRAGLEGAVVASFVERAKHHQPLEIHGDGTQTRDFVHVRDLVEALVLLGRDGAADGTWNVSSGTSVSVADLADLVEAASGVRLPRRFGRRRPGDVHTSRMSAARLRSIGWRPKVTLANGLRELLPTT